MHRTILPPSLRPLPGRSLLAVTHRRTFTRCSLLGKQSSADAKKNDLLDRESMNPASTEHGKSGGGDGEAAHTGEAFDPATTDPGEEVAGSQDKDGAASPATVSPGNSDVNSRAAGMLDGSQQGANASRSDGSGSKSREGSRQNKKATGQ